MLPCATKIQIMFSKLWSKCWFNSTTLYSLLSVGRKPLKLSDISLTDLAPTIVLKYISLSWRDGTVGFGGSTFKEAIEKCLSMDQHSGTIVFQQFSTRKSLRPMINSENFSFSQKLSKKKILFLVMAGVRWVGDMCEICINSVAQFRTWRWKSSAK